VPEYIRIVSNTTPLINLAGVGLVDLLPQLYGSIAVADIVLSEYEANVQPNEPSLRAASWLHIIEIETPSDLIALLDAGKAATIALAERLQPQAVLLDERRGRRIAKQRGLPVIGTGAVLIEAKRQNILPVIKPILDTMVVQGRYISEHVRTTLLTIAGESDE
jgi:predicted nucleic acid-binding protein